MSTLSLASGSRLGPYEVASPLGAGGMGEVYRAHDTRLGRDVALKVLPAHRSGDPDRIRRFEQEARAAASLSHSNVLALHDVGTDHGTPYAVFELLEGQTLGQRLEGGPLPVRKAVDVAIQICRGLAAAHARGIVHRDLKPDNVFLTSDGQVKILDFGLARLTGPAVALRSGGEDLRTPTDPGFLLGTLGYMSPEQARGRAADDRSDIFSLGAILYEMLAGRPAFAGETPADTLAALLTQDPPEVTRGSAPVSPALDRVVRRCLERNPEERFQSARDVAFGLEAVVNPPDVAPPGPATRGRRPSSVAVPLVLFALATMAFVSGARRAPVSGIVP
jgi:serine/threonine protein kinase